MQIRLSCVSRLLFIACVNAAIVASAAGQVINEDLKILASDAIAGNELGGAISIDGGIVAIGAIGDASNGSYSGSVYIFDSFAGAQLFKLLPSDGSVTDYFGASVSINSGLVAIGAPGNDDNGSDSGSAYLFDALAGAQLFKLLPDDGESLDSFGWSVAVADGVVAVGAHRDNDNGLESGSVYLFDAATGVQLFKLLPSDGSAGDSFGYSISLDDGIVAVGAVSDDDNGQGSGSVYLFDVTTGVQLFKLLSNDGAPGHGLGFALSIDNGTVAAGALFGGDGNGSVTGSVYLFDVGTGTQYAKLLPNDGMDYDFFGGHSISLDNGFVVVGSVGDDDNGSSSGSVYLFDAATGVQLFKLLPSDGETSDFFGYSTSFSDGLIAIGAKLSDDNGEKTGSAYIFEVPCISAADTNHDGMLSPTDFTAWINAFNNQLPECDQNGDGNCTPTDFTAWIASFNAGCP